jgi:hypothetical protein
MAEGDSGSDVLSKIKRGQYRLSKEEKAGKLRRPEPPNALRKSLADLTDDELQEAMAGREKYREELALYELEQGDIAEKRGGLRHKLRLDLEAEFGTGGHPKAKEAFELAARYAGGKQLLLFEFYQDLAQLLT